jgi:adenine-specific DNA-methyltransferase
MAVRADFGLMIWDGKSAGTALNVLRLVRAGKKAVLLNIPEKRAHAFKAGRDWLEFLSGCNQDLVENLRSRATPEEWMPLEDWQSSSVVTQQEEDRDDIPASSSAKSETELTADINTALASGDLAAVVEKLGNIAKAHGMSHVAKEAGLARESLYRSLNSGGNPEFSTVMKVMSSLGLRLSVSKVAER